MNLLLFIFIFVFSCRSAHSQKFVRVENNYDFFPQHKIVAKNTATEACVTSEGWWGTDITPTLFHQRRILIGYPKNKEYATIELSFDGQLKVLSDVCLCYKDRLKKRPRFDPFYVERNDMTYPCTKDFSMLCYAPGYNYVGGNVIARENFFTVDPNLYDKKHPIFAKGVPLEDGLLNFLKFELNLVDVAGPDKLIPITAVIKNDDSSDASLWIPDFERQLVKDVENNRTYSAIAVFPIQLMSQKWQNVKWCFKGGRAIVESLGTGRIEYATMDIDFFKAKDDFLPKSTKIEKKVYKLFEFARGSTFSLSFLPALLLIYFL